MVRYGQALLDQHWSTIYSSPQELSIQGSLTGVLGVKVTLSMDGRHQLGLPEELEWPNQLTF